MLVFLKELSFIFYKNLIYYDLHNTNIFFHLSYLLSMQAKIKKNIQAIQQQKI